MNLGMSYSLLVVGKVSIGGVFAAEALEFLDRCGRSVAVDDFVEVLYGEGAGPLGVEELEGEPAVELFVAG